MTDWAAHPLGDEGVVEVRLNFSGSMSPITAYDDSTCDATVSIPVFYEWIDPRMVDFAEGEPLPENLWQPEFHIYGGTNNADYGYGGAAGSLTLKDRATGCMLWMIVTNGVVYSCRASHDITDFPFDSQIVTIFFSCGKTVAGATDRVKYSVDRDFVQFAGRGSLAPRIERQSEWEVTGLAYGINQHSSSVKSYHNAYVAFKRQRIPSWYLHKGLAPTVMCAVLSLTANVVPSESIGDRMAILLTLLLTVFAVQWVTQDRLPRTPDLTYMDRVVNLVVILIVVSSVVSACFTVLLRTGVNPATIELAELSYGCFCAFVVLTGVLRLWLDLRRAANNRREKGYSWFIESKAIHPFMKRIEGCGFACAVIDGEVQLDDVVEIPGVIDYEGKPLDGVNQPDSNPLAGSSAK